MTMVKRIRILVLAAILGVLCFELSEQFLPPGVNGLRFHGRGRRWSPADAGERLRCCAQDSPTLCCGCLRLLNRPWPASPDSLQRERRLSCPRV